MSVASGMSFPRMLRDALFAGIVAAVLAFPMLGFRLVDSAQGLSLDTRFIWVAIAAVVVFFGRLALLITGRMVAPHVRNIGLSRIRMPDNVGLYIGIAFVVAAVLLPWLPFSDRGLVDKFTLILIYVMLASGLNIVVGLAGLLDLGYVAFYAIGAYSYALLSLHYGLSFWICLPLAGVFAAFFGVLLGFPVLRLRGDYLAIVTLGFGEIVRIVLINWQQLTGGPNGIAEIARPTLFGLSFLPPAPGRATFAEFFGIPFSPSQRVFFLYYLILALTLATILFIQRVRRLPIGRAWDALREDEIAARSLGLNPTTIKLSAFALGATFAGFAGSFFATRQAFISPESFTFIESAIILAIVVLGGMGSQIGIVLAAILLVGLPEWFRDLEQYRMLAFGGAMVLIMLWRPQGLISQRDPTVRLDAKPAARGASS
jgi:branched-chain amino acid transport system permease protein